MPARHKYKCLNPNCNIALFVTMNSPIPCCPKCGARRIEDFGETTFDEGYTQTSNFGISTGQVKQSDNNLRRIADRYGMTNMDNKDGRPAKRPKETPQGNGATVKIGGIDVPVSVAGGAGCINIPGMAQSMKAQVGVASSIASPTMKQMTRIAAEHKA